MTDLPSLLETTQINIQQKEIEGFVVAVTARKAALYSKSFTVTIKKPQLRSYVVIDLPLSNQIIECLNKFLHS